MIQHTSKGYRVVSHTGKSLSRPYKTHEEAAERLRQIEYFKHAKPGVPAKGRRNER